MKANLQPIKVDLKPGWLILDWSDGQTSRHSLDFLRRQCPCATCQSERDKIEAADQSKSLSSLRVIQSDAPAVTKAEIEQVKPVGRYALSFVWNDGHATGIYSYDFLREHTGR